MPDIPKRIYPQRIKTCLQEILDNGINESPVPKNDFNSKRRKAIQYLAMEHQKLGSSLKHTQEILIELNLTKFKPQLKDNDIIDLIEWIYKQNKNLGCTGKLIEQGFCKKNIWGECSYFNEYVRINQGNKIFDDSLYDTYGWLKYLTETFRNGFEMNLVYKELRSFRNEKNVSQAGKINVGFLKLAMRIRAKQKNYKPSAMTITSAMKNLEKVGLVKKVEQGMRGKYSGKANGYVIIYPIPHVTE